MHITHTQYSMTTCTCFELVLIVRLVTSSCFLLHWLCIKMAIQEQTLPVVCSLYQDISSSFDIVRNYSVTHRA